MYVYVLVGSTIFDTSTICKTQKMESQIEH